MLPWSDRCLLCLASRNRRAPALPNHWLLLVYINQVNTVDELIQTHATTLADVFDIKLQQKEKNLLQIYWIPKLHKTPYKARFIAGSRSCTTTRLSKSITDTNFHLFFPTMPFETPIFFACELSGKESRHYSLLRVIMRSTGCAVQY